LPQRAARLRVRRGKASPKFSIEHSQPALCPGAIALPLSAPVLPRGSELPLYLFLGRLDPILEHKQGGIPLRLCGDIGQAVGNDEGFRPQTIDRSLELVDGGAHSVLAPARSHGRSREGLDALRQLRNLRCGAGYRILRRELSPLQLPYPLPKMADCQLHPRQIPAERCQALGYLGTLPCLLLLFAFFSVLLFLSSNLPFAVFSRVGNPVARLLEGISSIVVSGRTTLIWQVTGF
jgi:hypothetical protein